MRPAISRGASYLVSTGVGMLLLTRTTPAFADFDRTTQIIWGSVTGGMGELMGVTMAIAHEEPLIAIPVAGPILGIADTARTDCSNARDGNCEVAKKVMYFFDGAALLGQTVGLALLVTGLARSKPASGAAGRLIVDRADDRLMVSIGSAW